MAPARTLFLLLLLAPVCAWCEPALRVVTSNMILADFVRQAGGDRVLVSALIPAGTDPHTWSPTPRDARALAEADLVVINGLGLEPWIQDLAQGANYKGKLLVASGATDEHAHTGHSHDHEGHSHGAEDPHRWMDPDEAVLYVRRIGEELARLDPDGSADYHQWSDLYALQLRLLNQWVQRQISTIPAERRTVLVNHDALGFYGEAYGVRLVPLKGLGNEESLDARRLAEALKQVQEAKAAVALAFSEADVALFRNLASSTPLQIVGPLPVDTLAASEQPGPHSYIDLMRILTRALVRSLVPAGASADGS